LGTPISAAGCIECRQRTSAARPMPGSISTGTAPIANSAYTIAISSGEGRTNTATRVPAVMPRADRPEAIAALRSCSSA